MYTVNTPVERPIWKNHKIIGYITMSRAEADRRNSDEAATVYYGFTDKEFRLLQYGTEDELKAAGFFNY